MNDDRDDLSLQELADRTGLSPRAIRSFIEQGLLRGPDTLGRNARYSIEHVDRLLALRALRERRGLSLGETRRTLLASSPADIRELARSMDAPDAPLPESSRSALAYLRSVLGPGDAVRREQETGMDRRPVAPSAFPAAAAMPAPAPSGPPPAPPPGTPVDRLLLELQDILGPGQVPVRARGEHWYRIPITPDVELSVRGTPNADQLARLERIADHLREILLGRLGP